jgi:hypothetical protein
VPASNVGGSILVASRCLFYQYKVQILTTEARSCVAERSGGGGGAEEATGEEEGGLRACEVCDEERAVKALLHVAARLVQVLEERDAGAAAPLFDGKEGVKRLFACSRILAALNTACGRTGCRRGSGGETLPSAHHAHPQHSYCSREREREGEGVGGQGGGEEEEGRRTPTKPTLWSTPLHPHAHRPQTERHSDSATSKAWCGGEEEEEEEGALARSRVVGREVEGLLRSAVAMLPQRDPLTVAPLTALAALISADPARQVNAPGGSRGSRGVAALQCLLYSACFTVPALQCLLCPC